MTIFVSRSEWGARPPRSISTNIAPSSCTAHYGGGPVWNGAIGDHSVCAGVVRSWQNFHMDGRGWSDIAYNMVACPHDYVFQGRGHGVRSAANGSNAGNQSSYAICYLGGEADPLTDGGKRAFRYAAQVLGQPLSKVHSDWFATSCPGDQVRSWVRAGAPPPVTGGIPQPPPEVPTTQEDAVRLIRNDVPGDPGRGQVWAVWSDRTRTPVSADHYPHLKAYAEASGGVHTNIGNAPAWSVLMQTFRAA